MSAVTSIECPACGLTVPLGTAICPQDGTPLVIDENGPGGRGSSGQRPGLQGSAAAGVERAAERSSGPPSRSVEVNEDELHGSVRTGLRDPLIGAMLGEYRVDERIGLGGMGLVYRGLHPVINKPVAIKVLRPEICDSASHVERLLEEARAVNAIRHRGIIDIFAFGKTPDGRQYLVMEFLDGVALDTHIANRGMLAPNEAVSILEEMCAALAAAHGAGVIHRDLKPNNIFLVKQGYGQPYVKLLDFGLAKQGLPPGGTTPQTHFGLVVGTPEYMAPEQARGENVGPKTDLYALGVVAYQMLTGHLPFEANSPMEYVVKHLEHPAPVVIDEQPDVPEDLSDLVFRLLAKAPEDRPSSAEEVRRTARRIARAMPQEITHVGAVPVPIQLSVEEIEKPGPAEARAAPEAKEAVAPSPGPAAAPLPPPAPAQLPRIRPPSRSSRSAPTVVTLTPRARRAITFAVLALVLAIASAGAGLAARPPLPEALPVLEHPFAVAEPPPPVLEPPFEVVEPSPAVRTIRPRGPPSKPPKPPKPPLSLARVLARIESLGRRYAESPAPSRLAAVALSTKRMDALRSNPDELRTIWEWLDRWENQYLPGH